jgi:hypothetical protein
VSQDNSQNRTCSEDTDLYFPTVEEILASARTDASDSSNATDMSEHVAIDTDTCLPGSNATSFGRVQFGISKGMYSSILERFDSNRLPMLISCRQTNRTG